jgi:hypothetical protein
MARDAQDAGRKHNEDRAKEKFYFHRAMDFGQSFTGCGEDCDSLSTSLGDYKLAAHAIAEL